MLAAANAGLSSTGEANYSRPDQRIANLVLDEWRAIERRLAAIDAASEEAEGLIAQAKARRDEYRHLMTEAAAHHRPLPAPFPEDELLHGR